MNFVRLEPRTDGDDVWAMLSKKTGGIEKARNEALANHTTFVRNMRLSTALCPGSSPDFSNNYGRKNNVYSPTNQWVGKGPTMHTFLFQCCWGESTYVPSVQERVKCHCLYYTCCTQHSIIFSLNKHLAMRKASTIPLLVKHSNSFVQ